MSVPLLTNLQLFSRLKTAPAITIRNYLRPVGESLPVFHSQPILQALGRVRSKVLFFEVYDVNIGARADHAGTSSLSPERNDIKLIGTFIVELAYSPLLDEDAFLIHFGLKFNDFQRPVELLVERVA